MNIAIFGGGGFIGSAIVDRLLKDGHKLRIFERPRVYPFRSFAAGEQVEWVTGDLMSMHDVSKVVDGVDVVLHLVSTTLPKSSNDDPIYDVQSNLVATLQMLSAIREKGVGKIVFISSGGTVYGEPSYLPIDEAHPTEPQVSYGITKLAIEKYLLLYQRQYGIKVNILRVTNPYGERQRVETAQGAVGVFLSRALQGLPLDIWGDGSVTRDYIHVSDVAEAFSHAVAYDGAKSVFNISSGMGTSLNELIENMEIVLGRSIERRYLKGRPFDVPVSVLDNSLARHELDWHPTVSLLDGVRRTALWMEKALEK
ncbi:NAD-dependent epimerase/dehydratase family protein [Crenobacter intestini]|uniref:UDP-glucose 4-epimerase n=1 Tax=Crenobacter intestini TaxID=2563443 RepID=A0A4T0UIZ2_9NEIS|nr:NAD-dependent epimerase/dehydratase family protein [Crenobacter intestini]TIC78507.1 NAD-dependent epimerase/dehydratase family protein [Crenobacter intestini]